MFAEIINKFELPKYREKQLNQAFFRDLILSWEQATTLPQDLREYLYKNFPISEIELTDIQISKKQDTIKALFKLYDGLFIESVLMLHEDRNTVCVSSQVGCPVGCMFCATGKMGFKRNLTAREIIDQVLYWQRLLKNNFDKNVFKLKLSQGNLDDLDKLAKKKNSLKVNNVVFMGMGEPLLNIDSVGEAIEILTADDLIGIGKRKITVSTSGYIKQLKQLVKRFPHIGLAISLHAPNQKLREKIMPVVAKNNPIDKLVQTAREYSKKTNRRVSFEYILINNFNDDISQARELGQLLGGDFLYHINLIRYNDNTYIDKQELKKPAVSQVNKFKEELIRMNIPVSVRVSMGEDIQAACGQLVGKTLC